MTVVENWYEISLREDVQRAIRLDLLQKVFLVKCFPDFYILTMQVVVQYRDFVSWSFISLVQSSDTNG